MVILSDDSELRVTFIDDDGKAYSKRRIGDFDMGDTSDPTFDVLLLPDDVPDEISDLGYDDVIGWELVVTVDGATVDGKIVDCDGKHGGAFLEVDQRQ